MTPNVRCACCGEIGEIRAQGPNIMLGYWHDQVCTRRTLRDGWLYTGDLATVDEDGWVNVKGRSGELVQITGNRIHPRELEDFVTGLTGIVQLVAVAFERPQLGMRLAVFVKAANEVSLDASA